MTGSGSENGKGKRPKDPEIPPEDQQKKVPSDGAPVKSEDKAPEPGSDDLTAGKGRSAVEEKTDPAAGMLPDEPARPETPPPYEEILEEYPLRDAAEDPVWSVRIVKGWLWFLALSAGGIILLTILGFFFD
jgi:hypothetical protein